MANKTCGLCKYYILEMTHCKKHDCFALDDDRCEDFEPKVITNGDRIRQGGNRKMAAFHMWNTCDTCVYSNKSKSHNDICRCPTDKTCVDGIEAWLNAPAESEVKR